jgi:hypothetical protein
MCAQYLREMFFRAYGTFLGSIISAHETWDLYFTCCVLIFCSVIFQVELKIAFNGLENVTEFLFFR